jgi:putative AbiEii toxin of type IV toxin-antitoxin system
MLEHIALENTGPAARMELAFAPRLNLLTGDNGVGKTFLLDVVAWAFAGHWFDRAALPRRGGGTARLLYKHAGHPPSPAEYSPKDESWNEASQRGGALVLYARANGSFVVCDPFRFDMKVPSGGEFEGRRLQLFAIDERGLLHGVPSKAGELITNGLLRDWATWQFQYRETFEQFQAVLRGLSAELGAEELRVGAPIRLSTRDTTDIPTLKLDYGEVPITHLSAGMRRVMGLAYMLVWVWFEHQKAAEVLQQKPLGALALIVDEVEAHLHPRWQRFILPSLLNVARALMPEVDVQIFASTHAPLVTASLEAHFDGARDALFEFDLAGGEVRVERATFRRMGEVNNWLTSEVFDLPTARSLEAERALKRAEEAMQEASFGPERARQLDAELRAVLGDTDSFWPVWRFFFKKRGWEL